MTISASIGKVWIWMSVRFTIQAATQVPGMVRLGQQFDFRATGANDPPA